MPNTNIFKLFIEYNYLENFLGNIPSPHSQNHPPNLSTQKKGVISQTSDSDKKLAENLRQQLKILNEFFNQIFQLIYNKTLIKPTSDSRDSNSQASNTPDSNSQAFNTTLDSKLNFLYWDLTLAEVRLLEYLATTTKNPKPFEMYSASELCLELNTPSNAKTSSKTSSQFSQIFKKTRSQASAPSSSQDFIKALIRCGLLMNELKTKVLMALASETLIETLSDQSKLLSESEKSKLHLKSDSKTDSNFQTESIFKAQLLRLQELKVHRKLLFSEVHKLCTKLKVQQTNYFNPNVQTKVALSTRFCSGDVLNWGMELQSSPPKTMLSPSPLLSKLQMALQNSDDLPELELVTAEPQLKDLSLSFQKHYRDIIKEQIWPIKIKRRKALKGSIVFSQALNWFTRNEEAYAEPVEVLGLMIMTNEPAQTTCHVMGIAKIFLPNASTPIFRLRDPDFGEFESEDPQKLSLWLDEYLLLNENKIPFTHFAMFSIELSILRVSLEKLKFTTDFSSLLRAQIPELENSQQQSAQDLSAQELNSTFESVEHSVLESETVQKSLPEPESSEQFAQESTKQSLNPLEKTNQSFLDSKPNLKFFTPGFEYSKGSSHSNHSNHSKHSNHSNFKSNDFLEKSPKYPLPKDFKSSNFRL